MGSLAYRCLHCGQGKPLVALSCTAALCLRCAKVYVDTGGRQVSPRLHAGVSERPLSLTGPALFRTPFYQHAAVVWSACMRCGGQGLDDCSSAVRGKPLTGGYRVVLHTQGRHGPSPPLPLLAPRGGYDGPGERGEHLQEGP